MLMAMLVWDDVVLMKWLWTNVQRKQAALATQNRKNSDDDCSGVADDRSGVADKSGAASGGGGGDGSHTK
jgi:hypothetical protein